MEQSNVNNLNGVGNFGHGFPEEVEPVEQELNDSQTSNEEETTQENVTPDEAETEKDNG